MYAFVFIGASVEERLQARMLSFWKARACRQRYVSTLLRTGRWGRGIKMLRCCITVWKPPRATTTLRNRSILAQFNRRELTVSRLHFAIWKNSLTSAAPSSNALKEIVANFTRGHVRSVTCHVSNMSAVSHVTCFRCVACHLLQLCNMSLASVF